MPVVVVNAKHDTEAAALKERLESVEALLEAERGLADTLRKSLEDLRNQTHALQTRLVHAELAHKDALAHEQALLAAAQAELARIRAAEPPAPRPRGRPRLDRSIAAAPAVSAEPEATADATPEAPPPRKRGRPRSAVPKEPTPLRWWTPSFKARLKA